MEVWNRGQEWSCGCMLGGGRDARTIGQACRRGAACHRANLRALRRRRLHTRAKRQRQKARSEISVGNDAARAAESGAFAPRVRVLRPGGFCPGKGRGRGAPGWMCRAGFGCRPSSVARSKMFESHQRWVRTRLRLTPVDRFPSRLDMGCDTWDKRPLLESSPPRAPTPGLRARRAEHK